MRGYRINPACWDRWTFLALAAWFLGSFLLSYPLSLISGLFAGSFLLAGVVDRIGAVLRRRE